MESSAVSADKAEEMRASLPNRPEVCSNRGLSRICLQKQVGGRAEEVLRPGLLDAEDVDDEHECVAALDLVTRAGIAVSEVTRDDDDDTRADLLTDECVSEALNHTRGTELRGLTAVEARVKDLTRVPVDALVVDNDGRAVCDNSAITLNEGFNRVVARNFARGESDRWVSVGEDNFGESFERFDRSSGRLGEGLWRD